MGLLLLGAVAELPVPGKVDRYICVLSFKLGMSVRWRSRLCGNHACQHGPVVRCPSLCNCPQQMLTGETGKRNRNVHSGCCAQHEVHILEPQGHREQGLLIVILPDHAPIALIDSTTEQG